MDSFASTELTFVKWRSNLEQQAARVTLRNTLNVCGVLYVMLLKTQRAERTAARLPKSVCRC